MKYSYIPNSGHKRGKQTEIRNLKSASVACPAADTNYAKAKFKYAFA